MTAVAFSPPGTTLREALIVLHPACHVVQYDIIIFLHFPLSLFAPAGSTIVSHRPTDDQRCFIVKMIVTHRSLSWGRWYSDITLEPQFTVQYEGVENKARYTGATVNRVQFQFIYTQK